MRLISLDDAWDIPIVKVILGGNRKKSTRGMLVFDMGLALTQLDIDLVETLGYSACDANGIRTVKGPTGDAVEGYVFTLSWMARMAFSKFSEWAAALIVQTQLARMSRLQNQFATQAQTPTV
jgi:hypothetical protein